MEKNLLEVTVNKLMEKFGAGNHKPGSGSAAAFQGMISAKLISTVISLTAEEKRRALYANSIFDLLEFQDEIENRIYPRLVELFLLDSVEFDKTIKLREARDSEKDEIIKNQLRRQALEQLKISIAIPLEIAELCVDLGDISGFVFDNGFKAARGDSQVGLSGSVSATAGCMAIIRLNVLSFNSDEFEYCNSVVEEVNNLDLDYQRLSKIAESKIEILKNEFDQKIPLFKGVNDLINKCRTNNKIVLEDCVRDLQILIWDNKHLIWKKNVPETHLDILRPDVIFKQVLGFDYLSSAKYAVPSDEGEAVEVAGVIDQPNKIVAVSNGFPNEVQKFTAAHELGHAFLHEQPILHRDIPVDCLGKRGTRDKVELDADKFATYFLMPKKWVRIEFAKRFSNGRFEINEDSSFKFNGRSSADLKNEYKTLRELSRKLASAQFFNNTTFVSLTQLFNVSTEAMAIRLEELDLVKY